MEGHRTVVRLHAAWSACTAAAGHSYASPSEPSQELARQLTEAPTTPDLDLLADQEVQVARADLACRAGTGYDAAYERVLVEQFTRDPIGPELIARATGASIRSDGDEGQSRTWAVTAHDEGPAGAVRTSTRAAWRAAAVASALATLASGCVFAGERVCAKGEDSALFLEDGRLQSGTCVRSGEQPPAGSVRWPRDLEPTCLRDRDDALAEFQRRLDDGTADVTPAPTPS